MLFPTLDGSNAWVLRAAILPSVGHGRSWLGKSKHRLAGLTWAGFGSISEHSHLLGMLETIS